MLFDTDGKKIDVPSLKQAGIMLRNNPWVKRKYPILRAYLAGSVVRGEARPDSDLDILLVIPRVRGKSALKLSERYHSRFEMESQRSTFKGRLVDFQFYYEENEHQILTMNNPILLT
jgi:predicted nucleotidyltransferase